MEGKAKEAFKKWFDNKYLDNWNYYNIPENNAIINALTIEWLDSEGIYIDIGFLIDYKHWYRKVETKTGSDYERGYDTRQEAAKAAIKKAEEIYNEKYNR
ncbi:hypothetical protein HZQ56_17865 [Elizabethkingia anophelis]|uniref:hypothetical protein n=1 Tax=Elizabethkingia anophelis TaxID=1117645 RepID=UPI0021A8F5A8|nr:hypothetical protein [Elizabethkingia anophelis]MCT3875046.1 hypothetical protein [Elizabethkingia anophelis]